MKSERRVKRREFISTGATLLVGVGASASHAHSPSAAGLPPSMLQPGRPDDPYGEPSSFEKDVIRSVSAPSAYSTGASSSTPIHLQKGVITPSGLHFGLHHSGIPEIDPETHDLFVHGMIERALKFSTRDLMRYPLSGGLRFLECSGNTWSRGYYEEPGSRSCQQMYGLLSGSEWLGVPVRILLEEAGLKANAKWVIAEGADACSHARSIPIEKLMDDAIIALYQNGERLRPAQGYPMRLFLPGWEGNANVKWLRRLEVSDRPAFTQAESREYTETLPDGSIERFSFAMGVKSVITHPSGGHILPDKGFYELCGLAWSGAGKIRSVQVSDDGGNNWREAKLHAPIASKALTRFSLPWRWSGQSVRLQSRARDEFGAIQPTHAEWKRRYYPGSYNHYNAIQTWSVGKSGEVVNDY